MDMLELWQLLCSLQHTVLTALRLQLHAMDNHQCFLIMGILESCALAAQLVANWPQCK